MEMLMQYVLLKILYIVAAGLIVVKLANISL